jgi:hypothetical protein
VGVDLGRGQVTVAEKLLHGPGIVAILEQVRREGVTEGDRLVQVVAAALASQPVDIEPRCRKHPLPYPFPAGIGQLDPAGAGSNIVAMLLPDGLEMIGQGGFRRGIPSSRCKTARASPRVRTTGSRRGRLARTMSSNHGTSTSSTSR